MKISTLLTTLVVIPCFFLLTGEANAQARIYGTTSSYYNESTGIVTSTAATEVDYSAQDFYNVSST